MAKLRVNNRRKSSISMQQFITELGENFSEHMKEKLMELDSRSFLTRKDVSHRVDLKHVEHIQYECVSNSEDKSAAKRKEYSYAQFAVVDGVLYFSERCLESDSVKQSPIVEVIYDSLGSEGMISDNGVNLKKIGNDNIDYVVDNILTGCPQVSQTYLDIIRGMVSRSGNK